MNHPKIFLVIVDGDKYEWDKDEITGAELRALAGIPDSAQIFLHVPGQRDKEIFKDTVVELRHDHPTKFSTQSPGSQAG
jgi:hypothetical protein